MWRSLRYIPLLCIHRGPLFPVLNLEAFIKRTPIPSPQFQKCVRPYSKYMWKPFVQILIWEGIPPPCTLQGSLCSDSSQGLLCLTLNLRRLLYSLYKREPLRLTLILYWLPLLHVHTKFPYVHHKDSYVHILIRQVTPHPCTLQGFFCSGSSQGLLCLALNLRREPIFDFKIQIFI